MSFRNWSAAQTAQTKDTPSEKPKDAHKAEEHGPQPEKGTVKDAPAKDA